MPGTSYHRLSGRFPLAAPLGALAGGVLAGAVLSWVYGYSLVWLPFVMLNVLVILGYGAGVGWAVARVSRHLRVRNVWIVMAVAAVAAIAAEYFGWVAWVYALSEGDLLALDPFTLAAVEQALAEKGVWSLSGGTPTGGILQAFWVGEFLLIVGTAVAVARALYAPLAYCETCQDWLPAPTRYEPFHLQEDPARLRGALEEGRWEALDGLTLLQEVDSSWIRLETRRCLGCSNLHLVKVARIQLVKGQDNRLQEKETVLVAPLEVSAEALERVRARASAPA